MTTNEQDQIAPALIKAIAETQDVHADSDNPFHKSRYASLSAHLKVIKPIFAKHGLAILQLPTSKDGAVGISTVILHTSGQSLATTCLIPLPSGAKGQDAGGLISYLRRYGIAAVAGVATEDDDGESDRVSRTASAPAPARQAIRTPSAPASSSEDIDPNMTVPFGNNEGKTIGELGAADLDYWANRWEIRPYKGEIQPKDLKLKATAKALLDKSKGGASEEGDDVPF